MDKAMDFESEVVRVQVRIPVRAIFFFFLYDDDDGGATRSGAGEREARASTCRNERSECRR